MKLGEEKDLTIDQIKAKKYSLKYDDYFKEKTEEKKDGWIKLGDVVKYIKYESKKDNHKKENGKYPFYNSSIINHLLCDEHTNDEECLIINKVNGSGKCKIYYNNGPFSATSAVIIFKTNDTILIRYLYYYLTINKRDVESKYTGSDKKSLNITNFGKILIPNLPLAHQQEIVTFLDEIYKTASIEDTIKYMKDQPIFNLLINKDYEGFKTIIWYQQNIKYVMEELENVTKKKNYYIKSLFNAIKYKSKIKKLGEIVQFNIGGTPSRKEPLYWNNGDILWVSVAELNGNVIIDTKEKITETGIKNSSVKLINKGSVLMSFKLSIGKMAITGTDMYCNEAIMFFKHAK